MYYALSTTTLSEQGLSWFVDNTVTKRLLAVPGVAQVSRGGGVNREIRVELDPARMQALGITAVQVNQQLRQLNLDSPGGRAQVGGGEQAIRVLGGAHTALQLGDTQIMLPGGRFARLSDIAIVRDSVGEIRSLSRLNGRQATTKFSLSDRQVPIRVSLIEETRRDLGTLENLPVPTAMGGIVPLKSVADISFGEGPTRVRRYNQSRRVAIEADLNGVELGTAMSQIYALPALKHLPQGVRLVETGDAQVMKELFTNFSIAMTTGVLMVFAVLVLLFARVLQPITILSSLPLSLGGAVVALALTRHSVSLGVMIGFLMLMGIVAKNSILLVDFAIEEMRAGKDRLTAILEAGHKRARPIVMTTVAMVAGMLPVAVGLGGDEAFRGPMSIAVIGGLITSTGLTLVVVPAAFTLIDDIERWLGPKFGRVLVAQPPPAPAPPSQPHPAA